MKKRINGGGGSVYKRGPRWWISYYGADGERIRKPGGATRREAQSKLREMRRLAWGQSRRQGRTRPGYPLEAAIEEYLLDLRARGCKPKSITSARTTTNAALAHWGSERPLVEVATRTALRSFLAARDCRNETLRKDLRVLGAVFRLAQANGKLRELYV